MVQTSKLKSFSVKKVESLIWCEIDDEEHLNRALTQILPKIKVKHAIYKKKYIIKPWTSNYDR